MSNDFAQQVLTDQEFNDIFSWEVEHLMQEDLGKALVARLSVFTKSSLEAKIHLHVVVAITDMGNPGEERQKMFFGLGNKLAEEQLYNSTPPNNPVLVMFASEVWMLNHDMVEGKKFVSDHEDKKEAILLTGLSLDGRSNLALFDIKRNKQGKIKPMLNHYQEYRPNQNAKQEAFILQEFYRGVASYHFNERSEKS